MISARAPISQPRGPAILRIVAGRRRPSRRSPVPFAEQPHMISARPPISERRGKSLAHRDEAPPTGVHHMVNECPPDGGVVPRVLGGDGEAFGILIRRYEPGLLRFATRMLGNPDAAADAVAESLVRAYRHLAQCRDPARLRSWLYRITGNRCRSHLARGHTSDIPLSEAAPLAASSDSRAGLGRGGQFVRVERAWAALPAEKREAVVLKHVEGMSYEEMAAVTGARIPTLKMRVHRAREALLEAMEEVARRTQLIRGCSQRSMESVIRPNCRRICGRRMPG